MSTAFIASDQDHAITQHYDSNPIASAAPFPQSEGCRRLATCSGASRLFLIKVFEHVVAEDSVGAGLVAGAGLFELGDDVGGWRLFGRRRLTACLMGR
jgi:hypothetical protein